MAITIEKRRIDIKDVAGDREYIAKINEAFKFMELLDKALNEDKNESN